MNDTKAKLKWLFLLPAVLALLSGCEPFDADSEPAIPKKTEDSSFFYPLADKNVPVKNKHSVYIPVYSNIFISGGGSLDLAITLTVRNTDFNRTIIISAVNYYDTAGRLIEKYLPAPYVLAPMASTYFFVNQADSRGGSGANFIVQWSAEKPSNAPIIEAVMAGSRGTHGISFITQGSEIRD